VPNRGCRERTRSSVVNNAMTNIPTELLRTFIAVVDLRSFTRAAQVLGVTQPAVSAQIKRLQTMLGSDLFDKSAPGVTLTEKGELVANFARRLLSINDQIVNLAQPPASGRPLRLGLPGNFAGASLPGILGDFRRRSPGLRFQIRCQRSDLLLRELRQGELDVVVALTAATPNIDAYRYWLEDVVWVAHPSLRLDATSAVPLVTSDEDSIYYGLATSLLHHIGRPYEIVFMTSILGNLAAAVRAGLGIMAVTRRVVPADLVVLDDPHLPKLPQLVCGIYLRDGIDRKELEGMADAIAEHLQPREPVSVISRAM